MNNDGQPVLNPDAATGANEADDNTIGGGQPAPKTVFVAGREQTVEELARNYEESTREALKWKAIAEEREERRVPVDSSPQLPAWGPKLVEAGAPETVVREMVSWFEESKRIAAEEAAAAKVQELVEGLAQISTAEGQADAALAREFDGYSKGKLDEFLNSNSRTKERYEKVFRVDPESAKRLAWLEYAGGAEVKGQPRHTTPPSSKRVNPGGQEPKIDLQKIKESAARGEDWGKIELMKHLMKGQV